MNQSEELCYAGRGFCGGRRDGRAPDGGLG
jgi:hypothetical protein